MLSTLQQKSMDTNRQGNIETWIFQDVKSLHILWSGISWSSKIRKIVTARLCHTPFLCQQLGQKALYVLTGQERLCEKFQADS